MDLKANVNWTEADLDRVQWYYSGKMSSATAIEGINYAETGIKNFKSKICER